MTTPEIIYHRDKLIELLQEQFDRYKISVPFTHLYKMAGDLVLDGVTAQSWIPVTEQLPKTDGRFMVTIKGKSGKPHVEMRNFNAGAQKWESQLGYVEENILAWQARPRPYGVKPRQADTELYGHWIYWDGWCGNHDRRIDDATCSVCGYKHPTVRATKEEWDTPKFLSDLCPGCGAKMKKGGACNAVV